LNSRQRDAWLPPAILLATLAVYASVLHGGFIWDDDAYVWKNLTLRSLHGLSQIWLKPGATEQYWPLTYTVFWAEYHLWGLNVFGYHLLNVLLHACNAILVGLILTRLRARGAWLAAFLFAVHPVELESVAWITELKNGLSGFFYLTALLSFLDYEESGSRPRWGLSLGLFTCAVLCKSVVCTLAAVLPLLLWARRGRLERRHWREIAPFWGVGLLMGSFTMWVEKEIAGASGPLFSFNPLQRGAIAGRSLCFYLGKLLWPSPLIFIYPRWTIAPNPGLQLLFPAAVAAAGAFLWRARARLGRWPLAAFLYFAITLAPALGFVSIYTMRFSFVADHFQYLASLGPIALFAEGLARGLEKLRGRPLLRYAIPSMLFLNLALTDLKEEKKYRNVAELWLDTLEKNPDCAMAHQNIGVLLAQKGDWTQGLREFQAASRLDPDLLQNQLSLAYAFNRLGRRDEALAGYRRAVELGASDPQILEDYAALKRSRPGR
jgi:tetratricopeptide (TPR) repeat protein